MDCRQRIQICKNVREMNAQNMAEILGGQKIISEIEFCKELLEKFQANNKIWPQGWYSPPPLGISALFAPGNTPQRLIYDNLRKEEFWPKENNFFKEDSLGSIYASPVDKETATIGDFGMTIYSGQDRKIQEHIKSCLEVVEKTAEFSQIGMEFREVHGFCQNLMREKGLNNNRTVTYTDKTKTNIGHTIPWSYEDPNAEELDIINSMDFEKTKNLISAKRINFNEKETFKILPNIGFTTEFRAENNEDPSLPNVFFHTIVTFIEGKKEILENFNPIFKTLGMDSFITSKY